MQRRHARPGFTIFETMVAAGIFSIIFLGGYAMLSTASHSFDRNNAQTNADVDAVLGMQHIIADLREAKSFAVVNAGPQGRMVITYPIQSADGSYDRYIPDPDPDNQVTYYLQNRTLWRLRPSESAAATPIRWGVNDEYTAGESPGSPATWTNESGVEELWFTSDSPLSVKITVKTSMRRKIPTVDPGTGNLIRAPKTTELTQRLVYLRNW